jgi:hypothetical protein
VKFNRNFWVYFIFWGMLFWGMSSCKRESPNNNNDEETYMGNYPLGDERNYLYFKPGSMWVYECDSTRELDTQYMSSCYTQWYHLEYIDYELLFTHINSINEGSELSSYRPSTHIFYQKSYKRIFTHTIRKVNHKNNSYGTDIQFFTPYDTSFICYGGTSYNRYIQTLSNFKVLDKVYDTVRVFKVEYGGGFPLPKYPVTYNQGGVTYYWAKNVGLVRQHIETIAIINGEEVIYRFNWNLKQYNVKQ